jgi:hypothetical protein
LLNAAQAVAYLGRVEPLVLRRLVSGRPRRCGRIVVPELARQEVRNGAQGATTGFIAEPPRMTHKSYLGRYYK